MLCVRVLNGAAEPDPPSPPCGRRFLGGLGCTQAPALGRLRGQHAALDRLRGRWLGRRGGPRRIVGVLCARTRGAPLGDGLAVSTRTLVLARALGPLRYSPAARPLGPVWALRRAKAQAGRRVVEGAEVAASREGEGDRGEGGNELSLKVGKF